MNGTCHSPAISAKIMETCKPLVEPADMNLANTIADSSRQMLYNHTRVPFGTSNYNHPVNVQGCLYRFGSVGSVYKAGTYKHF